nr:DNA-directed RNA polymerase V subunit 1 [Tanacetum cinerariifolium]
MKEEQKQDRGWGKKKEGWFTKRDHLARPVKGPNGGHRPGGPFTTPKQRPEIFTANGQEILNEIKPIIQCTHKIMHQTSLKSLSQLPKTHPQKSAVDVYFDRTT